MTKVLTYEDGIAAVYGGAILGGGGGGLLEEGLKLVKEIFAAGEPQIIDITELDDEDLVACVAMVGAPSAAEQYISNEQLCWSYRQMNAHTNHRLKASSQMKMVPSQRLMVGCSLCYYMCPSWMLHVMGGHIQQVLWDL